MVELFLLALPVIPPFCKKCALYSTTILLNFVPNNYDYIMQCRVHFEKEVDYPCYSCPCLLNFGMEFNL